MARLNKDNYIERRIGRNNWRNWWFVTQIAKDRLNGYLVLKLYLPKELIGKKIRLKLETIEDKAIVPPKT